MVLIGCRGCGKSSVGRLVAQQLDRGFVDTDERLEAAAGRTIATIFAQDGEATFRDMERRTIAAVVGGEPRVISVGGGAVLSAENRERLKAAGVCIWLTAPAEELHRRLQADPRTAAQRPALTALPGLEEVRHVLASRTHLYEALARHVVDTSGRTVEDVAREVVTLVSGGPASREQS